MAFTTPRIAAIVATIWWYNDSYCEQRENLKTNNQNIIGLVNVVRNRRKEQAKCFGVINQFYLHFMYPPSSSTYKLTVKKLAKISEPWILCAHCDWYEQYGTNPLTGLVQITSNSFWDGCPLINLANCFPENVSFWPSFPFNVDDFDEEGKPLDPDVSQYDFSGNGVYDVITHHQDLALLT